MARFLEAPSHEAWEVTSRHMPNPPTDSQIKWNAKARNAFFELISDEVFARVRTKETVLEVWEELHEVHKEKLNDFNMLPHELVEQMYSRLNVLIKVMLLKFLL